MFSFLRVFFYTNSVYRIDIDECNNIMTPVFIFSLGCSWNIGKYRTASRKIANPTATIIKVMEIPSRQEK